MIRPVVALDIGSTKVACAVGLPRERAPGCELLASSLVPYPAPPESWLGDVVMVSRAIEQALDAAAVQADVDRVLVAVNHPSLTSERVRVAIPLGDEPVPVRARDLDRLHASALDQALGIDREPLLVERLGCSGNGFEGVRDPRGLSATRLTGTVHVITIPTAARRALVQAVESAGLEIVRLTYTLPSVLAGLEEGTLTRRVLLIDVGGLSTDIGLFVGGFLHAARVVPWGGLRLATAIAKELRVTMEQALTWSLEGAACRKREVRALVGRHWAALEPAIEEVLRDAPRPDAALVTGRGALIDGFAEWVERTTRIRTSVGRSARRTGAGDLARQVGVSAAIGLLELATRETTSAAPPPATALGRVLHRARALLTDYF